MTPETLLRMILQVRREMEEADAALRVELQHVRYFQGAHASQSGQHQEVQARKTRRKAWKADQTQRRPG